MTSKLLLTTFIACLFAPLLGASAVAQTTVISTNMSEAQIQNAFSNASPGRGTTLDGQYRGGPIIYLKDRSDVIIRNLKLKGADQRKGSGLGNGVIRAQNADRLIVENCDIEVERAQGGVFLRQGGGQIIRNNLIYNPRAIDYEVAADLLYCQDTESSGFLIEGNVLNALGNAPVANTQAEHNVLLGPTSQGGILHIDNIQVQNCRGGTINANTLTIDTNIEQHFHAVLIGGGSGTYTVSNNYMHNSFTNGRYSEGDGSNDFLLGLQNSSSSIYRVFHNTIVGNGSQLMRHVNTNANSEFRNNIFYRREFGSNGLILASGTPAGRWSNNLFFNQGSAGSDVVNVSGFRNVNELDNFTNGGGSVFGDPMFVLEGPDLLGGSPAINAGTALAGIGDDLDGNSRSGTPTIGAIENGGGGGSTGSESITLDGPPAIPPSGAETFLIDYDVNGTRDITLTIFEVVDGNYTWKAARRIENVSGSGTWMGELSYPNISTSTAVIKAALLPDGGNWMDSLDDQFLDVDIVSSQPESITLDGPEAIEPSGSGTFTVDYNVNQPRDITVTVFEVVNGNYTWKGARRVENVTGSGTATVDVSYADISTSTAVIKAALLPDGGNWMDSLQDEFLNVDVGTVPESISVQGPGVVGSSGPETFTIDYHANGTRDLTIDIFEINNGQWTWRAARRIENVSGTGSWTGDLNYPNISASNGVIKVSLLPDGGNWMQSVLEDFLNIQIE